MRASPLLTASCLWRMEYYTDREAAALEMESFTARDAGTLEYPVGTPSKKRHKQTPREFRLWGRLNCQRVSCIDFGASVDNNCLSIITSFLTLVEARSAQPVSHAWGRRLQPHSWCESLGVIVRDTQDPMKLFATANVRLRSLELRPQTWSQMERIAVQGVVTASNIPSLRSLLIAKPYESLDYSPLSRLMSLEQLTVTMIDVEIRPVRDATHFLGLRELVGLSALRKLDLTECDGLSTIDYQQVAMLTQLKELVLVGCNSLSKVPTGLQLLMGLTRLDTLHISSTGLKGQQLHALRLFPRLTWLDFSEEIIAINEFTQLVAIPLLHVLRVAPPSNFVPDLERALRGYEHGLAMFRLQRPTVQVCTVQHAYYMP